METKGKNQLYSLLTPFTHSPQAYRISLTNTWGNNQGRQINQLFGSYGY